MLRSGLFPFPEDGGLQLAIHMLGPLESPRTVTFLQLEG
jgi:hypothetical protein